MKKLKISAALAALALSGIASAAPSVEKPEIYGVVDVAVRHATNDHAAGEPAAGKTAVIGGGLSQSLIGFRAGQDIGTGLRAFAQIEHRFNADSGSAVASEVISATPGVEGIWSQSLVGLELAKVGRISLGRQTNVLADLAGPRINAFEPGATFTLGERADNLVKYVGTFGDLTAAVQYSPDEGNGGKSTGATARYTIGKYTAAVGALNLKDVAGRAADAKTVSLAYATGPLALNGSFTKNSFDAGFDTVVLGGVVGAAGAYGVPGAAPEGREAISFGGSYRVTPFVTVSAQHWRVEQSGFDGVGDGKAKFTAAVVDYSLSRRTAIYGEVDFTKFEGAIALPNGEQKRTGYMVGVRHQF